jgi:hypothetical protein
VHLTLVLFWNCLLLLCPPIIWSVSAAMYFNPYFFESDRLCSLVVRVLGYRFGGPGSIPGTIRKKSSGSGTGSTQTREYNWGTSWKKK